MDISLLIFIVVILLFALRGYQNGIVKTGKTLITIIVAYAMTIAYSTEFTIWLKTISPISGLFAYLVGSSVLFLLSASITSLVIHFLVYLLDIDTKDINQPQKISGALLGSLIGAILATLFIGIGHTLYSLMPLEKSNHSSNGFSSKLAKQVNSHLSQAVGIASDQSTQQITAALLNDPAKQLDHITAIKDKGYITEILNSNVARDALTSRNAAQLLQVPAFQALIKDSDFIQLANNLKFVEAGEPLDQKVAVTFTKLWAQVETVKSDPQFIQLTQDPELQQIAQSRNIFKVMNSEKVERLIQIITKVEAPEVFFDPDIKNQTKNEQQKQKIYRWVDEKGRVHYSDSPPDQP